jgi:hypothetical protein
MLSMEALSVRKAISAMTQPHDVQACAEDPLITRFRNNGINGAFAFLRGAQKCKRFLLMIGEDDPAKI